MLIRLTAPGEQIAVKALSAVIAADKAFLEPLDQSQRDAAAAALKALLLRHESS